LKLERNPGLLYAAVQREKSVIPVLLLGNFFFSHIYDNVIITVKRRVKFIAVVFHRKLKNHDKIQLK